MKRFKQLLKITKGNRKLFIIVIFLTIFHTITYSYIPLFSQLLIRRLELYAGIANTVGEVNLPNYIIDFVNKYRDIIDVVLAIVLMLLIWQVIRYLFLFFENRLKGQLTENVAQNLRLSIYDHIQNLSYEYHNNVDSGDLIQRVTTDIDTTTTFVSMRVMDAIGLLSSLIAGTFQMYHVNQTIMWVSLAIIPITAISSIIYFSKIDKVYTEVEEKEAEMTVVIQENVNAAKIVRAFANERYEINKLEDKNKAYLEAEIKAGKIVAIYWGTMDFLMILQYFIVVILGIYFANSGLMDIASISSAIMLSGLLIWPVRGLGRIINDLGKALVASGRLTEIYEQKSEYINDGKLMPEIKGHIIFKDVSFKFNDTKTDLLKNINFEIKPNETVAIIGKTGSGKTTIINLLLRMYEYQGSITIDGVELKEINKKHLRSNIGTVLQDPFLYSNTVYENIKIANNQASYDDVIDASITAALDKDINTFQKGYETIVGERGTTLSGGQKQRVAIARILVSKKAIIIFDDALSALDTKTDKDIRSALSKTNQNQTNIIVTHRMVTARQADKIIVVNEGLIEAVGTHDELKDKPGLYQSLWQIQGDLEKQFLKLLKEVNENA